MQTPGPEHDDTFDFLFKIILIGDSNVGKTCVVQNFKSGNFSERQQNTIGVDFTVRTVEIDGKKVKVSSKQGGFEEHMCTWRTLRYDYVQVKYRKSNLALYSKQPQC